MKCSTAHSSSLSGPFSPHMLTSYADIKVAVLHISTIRGYGVCSRCAALGARMLGTWVRTSAGDDDEDIEFLCARCAWTAKKAQAESNKYYQEQWRIVHAK